MEVLKFKKIKRENIFGTDFDPFIKNNIINFSDDGIAVLYAPNGVGKTSFSKVLNNENGCSFECNYGTLSINEKNNSLYYVISDQNSRHIIEGKTKEFLLGDNIRKEFELKEEIDNRYADILENKLSKALKDEFNISKTKSKLIDNIANNVLRSFVIDIANKNSKGKSIQKDVLAQIIKSMKAVTIPEFSNTKWGFYISDIDSKDSIIEKIYGIVECNIFGNSKIEEIEENTVAIEILNRYKDKKQCIVCDHDLPNNIKKKKEDNKNKIFEELTDVEKHIVTDIVDKTPQNDPFNIKENLLNALKSGNKEMLYKLTEEFEQYKDILNRKINNLFIRELSSEDLIKRTEELYSMIKTNPVISDDDIIYIQEIISSNINKKITVERDGEHNLKILLNKTEFIGREREELSLSTGEQNFISLTFELLKAKNNDSQIIVLDDPISSFDSIYKNKIVYSIIKFLENKKQIILTHNTDLIRLLEVQKSNCFNLYLFNNFEGQDNGFIEVNDKEKKVLIFIPELLDFIRNDIDRYVHNEKQYLCSLIPFMRGYAKFIGNTNAKNELTKLMHGYSSEIVDITKVYNTLFNKNLLTQYSVSVKDILSIDLNGIDILSNADYPLLNRTLKHTLTYLYLRLLVEQKLVNKYNIDIRKCDNLGKIIFVAYHGNEIDKITKRVSLISKKTLLNEFNHFEGNMSIFQPAIDISESTLEKEKNDIINLMNQE